MVFQSINIRQGPREMLRTAASTSVFNTSLDLANVNA